MASAEGSVDDARDGPTPIEPPSKDSQLQAMHQLLELQLSLFPIFQHFTEKHHDFTRTNAATLEVEERIFPHLTGLTLFGPHKIEYRSRTLYFVSDVYLTQHIDFNSLESEGSSEESNFSVTFLRLGDQLSGHRGIVHGGLLATLLDEITCRLGFLNFASLRGVTANLNINYHNPTAVNRWICVKCTTTRKEGRKCWVRGEIYTVDQQTQSLREQELVCSCEILIIEPRWVEKLKH
ncbi:uncharacterized protein LODBEIA_P37460 [Lodderomyces beijingensis]|uniref:Thioesterase domain-containing protein n=1 Tax=Lodderomyces beijingensis TaxID=1775926 RepID=A0ABP0ZN16_9ASCO